MKRLAVILGMFTLLLVSSSNAQQRWERNYGGAGDDYGAFVQQTQDTGYIVVGLTTSFGNGMQIYLIKTNALGDTLWTRNYGGTGDDEGVSVRQTQDGGYIVAGGYNYSGGAQVCLIKTNALGDTLWTRTYGGAGNDWGEVVQQTQDGGYILVGFTTSFGSGEQVYLIKTNAGGDTLWTRNYGGTGEEVCISAQQTQDTGYILVGWTRSFGNGYQVYLVKTDANGSSGIENERGRGFEGPRVQGLKATPNPFTTFATVPGHEAERFSLYDVSGKRVGTYRGDRVGEGLAAGVYFLRSSESKDKPLRIVKVR